MARFCLRHEKAAPPRRRPRLLLQQLLIQRHSQIRLLHLHIGAGFSGQRVHRSWPQHQSRLVLLHSLVQLVRVQRLCTQLHDVPET
jgi:hypothetical protein